ncbi:MAG TPA: alkaline phosphatase family protein [Xanthobacteraceae bacterium]|nr:alkaline phosphatase family protein [Xanthobacteraceae bacterium]
MRRKRKSHRLTKRRWTTDRSVKNILFVMADQLRADYLSCYGHPKLKTPHIDSLAARGVRFSRAYVQAPVCGPSRMSFYTGRYMSSHGSTYNSVPLRIGEMTVADHLRPLGMRVALVGKTHMAADRAGMARLGLDSRSMEGVYASECGFEPYERDDGLWPESIVPIDLHYNAYLRKHGYEADNPWHDFANAGEGDNGEILSGWLLRHANLPARVEEQHSETAYMTNRAMQFIAEAGEQPWCLHLSYIKPHWPYIAPAPYHALYGPEDVLPPNRDERERLRPHPVYEAFMQHEEGISFSTPGVRERVIPAYMGLIKQIDDHLGRLWSFLEQRKLMERSLIVFTSDHGDYLGDHWLGEKELFHEESVRVPLILYDPDPRADHTRNTVDERLVEAIDLAPTFVEAIGGIPPRHILEGRSLLTLTRVDGEGAQVPWRTAAISECDFAFRPARLDLDLPVDGARGFMLRTNRWKYVLFESFRPQLFDLQADPRELVDLGADPAYAKVRAELHEQMFAWLRGRKMRVTLPYERIEQATSTRKKRGFLIGVW